MKQVHTIAIGSPDDERWNRIAALALRRGKSVDFMGYWQRHIGRLKKPAG